MLNGKPLLRLKVRRKTGGELFHAATEPLAFDLLSFWQWAASDLVSNALRGRLAEFLVAQALGIADGVRAEWDAYDLCTRSGLTIEVESSAYLQSWTQRSLSAICFDIRSTRCWDADTNKLALESRRQAHVYVFALLGHRDKTTLDVMDVTQWEFFVLPSAVLDKRLPAQRSLSLVSLLKLSPVRCEFAGLRAAIEQYAVDLRDQSD
jgi:hypothetical protein